MPTVLREGGYRFFFSREDDEPPHIHVEHGDKLAKFGLDPVELASARRFRTHELGALRLLVIEYRERFLRLGMNILATDDTAKVVDVSVSDTTLKVSLDDGREMSVPLEWFPRLRDASAAQRANWRLIGTGEGMHWPDVDEDISVAGLLRGRMTGRSKKRAA